MQKQFLRTHFAATLFILQEFNFAKIRYAMAGNHSLYFSIINHPRKQIWTHSNMDSFRFDLFHKGANHLFKYVLFQFIVSINKSKHLEKIGNNVT
jgi:hypothetical protein